MAAFSAHNEKKIIPIRKMVDDAVPDRMLRRSCRANGEGAEPPILCSDVPNQSRRIHDVAAEEIHHVGAGEENVGAADAPDGPPVDRVVLVRDGDPAAAVMSMKI